MGFRDFVKGRVKRAAAKATGRKSELAGTADAIRNAMASLPKEPDADGYVAVVPSELVKEGEGNTFQVRGHNIAVYRVQGTIYVIDDECAHENGPLGEGHAEGFVVTCPYHDWRYDLRNATA